ncbi:unnamed protein product [Ilex paraguariensis]|uniref:t-SNARE coiled-coil homology domain-containing protein n=1 Tax=Ilex paraguariensis TaxID=185542 RepID=A0ABC8S769_9AQUA
MEAQIVLRERTNPRLTLSFTFIFRIHIFNSSFVVDLLFTCLRLPIVQVSSAVDHVQSGNTALQKAKSLQRNSRKWMCIAILILLIIVAVIVVGVLKPWSNNKGA